MSDPTAEDSRPSRRPRAWLPTSRRGKVWLGAAGVLVATLGGIVAVQAASDPHWHEPDLYTVQEHYVLFFGQKQPPSDVVISNGRIIKTQLVDDGAGTVGDNVVAANRHTLTPGRAVAKAKDANPWWRLGIPGEDTVTYDADGNPSSFCHDDPRTYDEEYCYYWSNYRTGDALG